MPVGTLDINAIAAPTLFPSYPTSETFVFKDVTLAAVSYRVPAAQVAPLVPPELELEDEPLVTSTFVDYGMSTVGIYTEFVQTVEATYNGRKFDYTLILVLDNEAAIFAGREVYGYPKVFGKVGLDPNTGSRLITGFADRPAGRRVIDFDFIPEKVLPGLPPVEKRTLNLRVIPSPIPGNPPSIRQFVSVDMNMESPEVWIGQGSVSFPRKSVIDKWADFDILRYEGAMLAKRCSASITAFEE
ncbi:Acetoacetate decarboxylase (ADC) [Geosmithia morbida]|uniref:Acetoacetate decarboxylase (ADC) n=1 Tax=Geosmithia morbida TaxID=1094350 RepID=A0A9P4Z3B1_9HYPO|nr:Acetoacetate decarboxylase (ADC) [Geosmithia morbida]KAF4126654.1 Acetoacetate decarboxylase (ADC) [Geosmithia morbida]